MKSDELLAAAEATSIAEGIDEWHGLMKVLLKHLSVLPIPSEIQSSLETAEAYWSGDPPQHRGFRVSKVKNLGLRTLIPREDRSKDPGR